MSLGSRAAELEQDGGIGPNDAPVIEEAVENVTDGSEETLAIPWRRAADGETPSLGGNILL